MSDDSTRCPSCAAPIPHPRPNFCGYCGAGIPSLQPAAAPSQRTGPELLAAVEAHPDFRALRDHRPSAFGLGLSLVVGPVFLLVFIVVALVMVVTVLPVAGPLAVVPMLMAGFGVVMFVVAVRQGLKFGRAPLVPSAAVVLDERVNISGGGRNSSAKTTYFATLELPDGQRREFRVDGGIAGDIVEGDAGVAYLKGPVLVDFRRLDVAS